MADFPLTTASNSPPPADHQNVILFRIYVFYRSIVSILLLLSLLSEDTRRLVGILNRDLYFYVALGFLATNLILLALITSPLLTRQANLFLVFFVDIAAIALMSNSSGGIVSGLPILLVVTAAASAVLISSGTIATLIAALSVIAVLADTLRLINEQVLALGALVPAGLLGTLIFAVSLLIQFVSRRVSMAEALARRRAANLYDLQRLNEQIVQNLQTGILMVYSNGTVRVMNQAATRLLDPDRPLPLEQGQELAEYNEVLAEQFEQWQENGVHEPSPITLNEDAPPIIASFRTLSGTDQGNALVFIEDYSPVTRQAQSLKLGSLGRLTASIAHEIRNPLGAVSHAAQLLSESSALPKEDAQLTEIIQHHSQRMNDIIENVMHISRRQPPRPQSLALRGWLENYLDDYRAALTDSADIQLDIAEEATEIRFDPAHLQRILNNLIDNARRHSSLKTGTESAYLVVTWEHLSRRCIIDVIDQGDGVPREEQAKLFEPFYTTAEQGTGLGLYLCKELCEINNATLNYRPTSKGESCFRVAIAES